MRRQASGPAGGALAVDRDGFSEAVTRALEAEPLITVVREEIDDLPPEDWDLAIVATGPLTSPGLAKAIQKATGEDQLAFFDAIAPIVHRDSIDMDICWYQSRYDKVGPGGTGKDYINCPMNEEQYNAFVDALIAATRPASTNGKARPISMAACRSRSWPSAAARRCATVHEAHGPDQCA